MSYPAITAAGVAVALVGALALGALVPAARRRAGARRAALAATVSLALLVVLTAVFDNLMIAAGLFHYSPDTVSGVSIGRAPLEDFAYPLACVLLLPALWLALARGGRARRAAARQFVLASRPVSWINTAFPFGAAYLMTTREVDWVLLVGTLYFLVPYNLAMYGINDVFDYESDLHNARKGGVEGALLAPALHRPMLWTVAATNLPFLLLLTWAGGPAAWLALAASVFAVIAYSAPPLRFKERPVLDSMTSSFHFVSPALVGLAFAGARVDTALLLLLAAFFLWGMAAHAFGAVQDVLPDRAAGISSIATVFGARATTRLAVVLWALAGVAMLGSGWPAALAALLAVPYLALCAPWWNVTDDTSAATNASWRKFLWVNYCCGFLVTVLCIVVWRWG